MKRDWYALSIRQPWIDLILRGLKTIEVRDWNVARRGPILLHASQTIDWQAIDLFGYSDPWALPRGRIVGCATIEDAFECTHDSWLATLRGTLSFVRSALGIMGRSSTIRGGFGRPLHLLVGFIFSQLPKRFGKRSSVSLRISKPP
jgi:hypothetical protein